MSRVIDPHIHLFDLEQGEYHWLQEGNLPNWPDKANIRNSYTEAELTLPASVELAGFVHIEAGFDNANPQRELAWLEENCSLPFRSIAFLDLTAPDFKEKLAVLQQHSSLVGIRHILDEDAVGLLSDPQVIDNFGSLAEAGLLFEAQFPIANTEAVNKLCELMTALPALKVVISHCGSPEQLNEAWMESIMRLAHHMECYIKCSGWEMFKRDWQVDEVKPLINFAIRQFGLTRVMLASNFPVSELGYSYEEVWQRNLKEMRWKGFEQEMLVFENAKRIYQLDIN